MRIPRSWLIALCALCAVATALPLGAAFLGCGDRAKLDAPKSDSNFDDEGNTQSGGGQSDPPVKTDAALDTGAALDAGPHADAGASDGAVLDAAGDSGPVAEAGDAADAMRSD